MQPQKANADQTNINQAKPSKQSQIAPHPRIRHIVVVASGKGGVGKSTTTVNVALALQKLGKKVGVLDADIYGPSIPDMLGVAGVKPMVENGKFVPVSAFGMPVMSIGSLLDSDNTPVAWRGIKATGALMQLFNDTDFPYLDYLLIDMPPGTGDIQLTLAQRIPVTGAVIVTTPQHIALLDAQKGIEMFNKTDIGVVGVIENMALHTCTNCGFVDEIFGEGERQILLTVMKFHCWANCQSPKLSERIWIMVRLVLSKTTNLPSFICTLLKTLTVILVNLPKRMTKIEFFDCYNCFLQLVTQNKKQTTKFFKKVRQVIFV